MGGAGGGGYGGSVWQSYGDMLQGAGGPVGRSQDYHNEPFGGHRDSFGGLDQGIGGGSGGFMGGRGQGSDQGGFMGGGGGGRRGGLHDTSGGGYGQENLGGSGGYLRQQQQPDPYDGYGNVTIHIYACTTKKLQRRKMTNSLVATYFVYSVLCIYICNMYDDKFVYISFVTSYVEPESSI